MVKRLSILVVLVILFGSFYWYEHYHGLHDATYYRNIRFAKIGDDLARINSLFESYDVDREWFVLFPIGCFDRHEIRKKGGGTFIIVFRDRIGDEELESLPHEIKDIESIPRIGEQVVFEINKEDTVTNIHLSGIKDIATDSINGVDLD
ncbi:MAG: hypothetical protein KC940_16150 [Candidatus Omnitrophica bacterium]|nr:hypothetical protein [Candidatus Omnitrophota bacterium]